MTASLRSSRARPAAAIAALLLLATPAAAQDPAPVPKLLAPKKVEAKGGPIAAEGGHAAPFVVDIDRDGLQDLVVGQFEGGKARIYRNVGKKGAPRFDGFEWLMAGDQPASVPPS